MIRDPTVLMGWPLAGPGWTIRLLTAADPIPAGPHDVTVTDTGAVCRCGWSWHATEEEADGPEPDRVPGALPDHPDRGHRVHP